MILEEYLKSAHKRNVRIFVLLVRLMICFNSAQSSLLNAKKLTLLECVSDRKDSQMLTNPYIYIQYIYIYTIYIYIYIQYIYIYIYIYTGIYMER